MTILPINSSVLIKTLLKTFSSIFSIQMQHFKKVVKKF